MKIITWNCNGAFRKKFDSIVPYEADIIIVQECENPETVKDKRFREWTKNYLWTGENSNKGLGIFACEKVRLEQLDWPNDGLKYFLPCRVNDDFNLLGTWCHGANSPTFGYIGQLWKYLQNHRYKLSKSIIAGDFNSNVFWDRWDRWWNHSDLVRELREVKIESLYHYFFNEEQGKESQPTFYLQKNRSKPYHIDYIFTSEEFTKSIGNISIGEAEEWLRISDYLPIFCEFKKA